MYSTLLLKTLPVSEPEQLVELGCVNTNEPDTLGCNTSYPGFRMFRDENEVLSGLFAFAPAGELNAIYNGEAELATGLLATGDMHNVLGVSPAQSTTLMSAFALLVLLLASLGLYGVLSYAVTQRTNEIGVRMALGATSREILLSFGKHGLALTLTGLAVGLVLAAIAARLMTALLYGFRPDYIPTVRGISHSPGGGNSGLVCSRAPRVTRRSDDCPAE